MSKIKFFFAIAFLAIVSFYSNDTVRGLFTDFTQTLSASYYRSFLFVSDKITQHFNQADEIAQLRAQNSELEHAAALLSTFAYKLNAVLDDKQSQKYNPHIRLVSAINYANIGDYTKVWLDFDEFDEDKIYGLIYKGATAGIVIPRASKPLGILQTDPSAIFSVYIGEDKIAGVATGDGDGIIVRYITKWHAPKIGDKVYTSGLDGIFFAGILVGAVTEIKEQELYKSAVVEPAVSVQTPSFLYVITKDD